MCVREGALFINFLKNKTKINEIVVHSVLAGQWKNMPICYTYNIQLNIFEFSFFFQTIFF